VKEASGHLAYWNGAGATKTFTHPLHHDWLAPVGRDARILDHGCGYGRVTAELTDLGFTDVSGVDPSPALVERGRRWRPDLRLAVLPSPPTLPHPAGSFDLILLFAVLTCVPDDAAQRALVAEAVRVLAPGGALYISDMTVQDDARNQERYTAHARRFGTPYGVFATEDGALCRHHGIAELRALLADLDLVAERRIDVVTMNGNRSQGVQLLARKG